MHYTLKRNKQIKFWKTKTRCMLDDNVNPDAVFNQSFKYFFRDTTIFMHL